MACATPFKGGCRNNATIVAVCGRHEQQRHDDLASKEVRELGGRTNKQVGFDFFKLMSAPISEFDGVTAAAPRRMGDGGDESAPLK